MAKIVVLDSDQTDLTLEKNMVEAAGLEFGHLQEREADAIIRDCTDADGIITAYGQFTAKVFESLPKLQVVSRAGVGVDTVDLDAATDYGVAVCNVPGYATEVVSDHAIAMSMAILRRLPELNADVHAGIWDFTRHRPMG